MQELQVTGASGDMDEFEIVALVWVEVCSTAQKQMELFTGKFPCSGPQTKHQIKNCLLLAASLYFFRIQGLEQNLGKP